MQKHRSSCSSWTTSSFTHTLSSIPYPPAPPAPPSARGMELLGYLENWGPDIKWLDENMPGSCLMGCFKAAPLIEQIQFYSAVNCGFAFLTALPDPDQEGCETDKPAGKCDKWAGDNIYLAKAAMQGSIAVNAASTVEEAILGYCGSLRSLRRRCLCYHLMTTMLL